MFVVVFPCSFLILLNWVLSFFVLESWAKGLSIQFIFPKTHLLDSLRLHVNFFVSILMMCALIFIISLCLLDLDFVSSLSCITKANIYSLSEFLMSTLRAMSSLIGLPLMHLREFTGLCFYLVTANLFISFLVYSWTHSSFSNGFFHLPKFIYLLEFFFPWQLYPQRIHKVI